MKQSRFYVRFSGTSDTVIYAITPEEAYILACAARINSGLDRKVEYIINEHTGERWENCSGPMILA